MRGPRTWASRTIVALLAVLAPHLAGCSSSSIAGGGASIYRLDSVVIESRQPLKTGDLNVFFRAPAETMWSCPGVDVETQGDVYRVAFVRSGRTAERKPMIQAEAIPGTDMSRVLIPGAAKGTVILVDDQREIPLWENGAPPR